MRAPTSSAEPNRLFSSRALEPQACRVGAMLGRWQLVEFLAAGGTADVWRAVDAHGAEAALKIVPPASAELLLAEHAVLATLRQRAVVRVVELVRVAARPAALALEFLPGGDLVPLLGAAPRHWLTPLRGLFEAVRHLHDRGIAHRDIKARNVLFAADGTVRLVDFASVCAVDAFGAARAGATAAHLPAHGAATGREADLYALAVLVYELATGRLPFGVAGAHASGARPAPWASADAATARLVAAASDAIAADGRVAEGLSAFADVIESAAALHTDSER